MEGRSRAHAVIGKDTAEGPLIFPLIHHSPRVTLSEVGVLWNCWCLTGEHQGPGVSARLILGTWSNWQFQVSLHLSAFLFIKVQEFCQSGPPKEEACFSRTEWYQNYFKFISNLFIENERRNLFFFFLISRYLNDPWILKGHIKFENHHAFLRNLILQVGPKVNSFYLTQVLFNNWKMYKWKKKVIPHCFKYYWNNVSSTMSGSVQHYI